ncbi:thioredoxin family protein [Lederbergia galactosidilytica]|uniref:Thioredoxin n=1 Tax=Lederbergia galactosidilytica TaxID=217031 RepID=A0A177ZJK3_9BACI|nr:thioredoxin family protein [Lederbergia galactosidilytica]KRG16040.1 thioredoxin [Virgibacillus soli]MBP1915324.1 thiol-disulfide isomerase/thioredoxin [Lederbergia galactosidilytica]OAK68146.1 thioredoxin [Lederbergia galactosidilytica]
MEKLQSMEQFDQLKKEERTIFMFSADWCPDCRFIDPFLPRLEADYPEYTFIYVDRDQFIDLCSQLDIFGIPSFLAFHNGEEAGRFVSKDRKTLEEIEDFINGLAE